MLRIHHKINGGDQQDTIGRSSLFSILPSIDTFS